MCGIAGFIHKEKVDLSFVRKMGDAIRHRGPDDHGELLEPYDQDYLIGLAHRRLSILDLSPLGHQPMITKDDKVVIVFNGEIYNFLELRKDLEGKGYVFDSHSDTEVLLYSYQAWGIDFIEKLNGMFAIALYDRSTKDFYLIRDRMGVKPLYYYHNESGIIFGSELKSLMIHPGFHKKLNRHALSLFLYHGYITAPHSIFENAHKLSPGSYLHFKNGKISLKTYWSIAQAFANRTISHRPEQQALEELDHMITQSVKDRLVSDVPVGCFLSGGIDSSLMAAIMQKLSSSPIKTFTIGFDDGGYNEAPYARKVAQHLGTEHYEKTLSLKDAQQLILDIPTYYDEPFADSSQLPTMLLSRMTRQHVTVALSGDGGDEFFCGYDRYETILRLQKFSSLSKIAQNIPFFKEGVKLLASHSKYSRLFELADQHSIINSEYLNYLNHFSGIKNHKSTFDPAYQSIMDVAENFQEKHMLQDMVTYLPDDILTKVDRASMAFSLEVRTPLIDDHRLVDFSFSLPHELKYNNGQKKYILKKLLYKYVPRDLVDRPKMGFGVPIYDWLYSDLRYLIDLYLSDEYIKEQDVFDLKEIEKIRKKFLSKNQNTDAFIHRTAWYILVFQLWWEKWFK